MKRLFIIIFFTTGLFPISNAQRFWLTTYSFPGGPKTGITMANDSCLFVGLTNNVIRSCNDGYSWDSTLNTNAIFTLFTTNSGRVLAGGDGKIFYTDNLGESWDTATLNTSYPVTKIIQNVNGDLFAITGVLDINLGFVGAGVFYSGDNGNQWTQRNNGLGSYLSCEQITHDDNGRLYLAVADEFVSGNAGLFISDNSAQQWQHIAIDIDGQNVINNRIKVGNTRGLSVSPDDSIYMSFSGTAFNVGVTLNIHKSIYDVTDTTKWTINTVSNVSNWYNDRQLNNIHFAANGDWYSSMPGSLNTGGTFFSIDKGRTWNQQLQGLGFDQSGQFSVQYFSENDSGKIYMVQLMDERIYWADTSVHTAVPDDLAGEKNQVHIFPNPVKTGGVLKIQFADNSNEKTVTVTDILGRTVFVKKAKDILVFDAPTEKGIYLVNVKNKNGNAVTQKIFVY